MTSVPAHDSMSVIASEPNPLRVRAPSPPNRHSRAKVSCQHSSDFVEGRGVSKVSVNALPAGIAERLIIVTPFVKTNFCLV